MSDRAELTTQLKAEARRLGFALSGIAPAVTPSGLGRFHEWLASGYAGTMRYLEDRAAAYEHPRSVLEGVRSVVMLAMPYRTTEPEPTTAGFGRVSRYAWGEDYHDLIHDRLHQLADWLRATSVGAKVRGVVDTAPLLEREFAQLAGLGWIGKNTLLLNRKLGSWFFLAGLLTDVELAYDSEHETDHCGTCTACLDACPTEAFVGPYVLDARKCISYTTIELREEIPLPLRRARRLGVRLRRLPRRLSVESQVARRRRADLHGPGRREPAGSDRAVRPGRSGLSQTLSRHAALARTAARHSQKRRDRARQSARITGRGSARQRAERRGAAGSRGLRLGSQADSGGERHSSACGKRLSASRRKFFTR
ncbi:MAG: tRNA epoxyqueuosine(34) reductase QueG [Pirellulales bacterium]